MSDSISSMTLLQQGLSGNTSLSCTFGAGPLRKSSCLLQPSSQVEFLGRRTCRHSIVSPSSRTTLAKKANTQRSHYRTAIDIIGAMVKSWLLPRRYSLCRWRQDTLPIRRTLYLHSTPEPGPGMVGCNTMRASCARSTARYQMP